MPLTLASDAPASVGLSQVPYFIRNCAISCQRSGGRRNACQTGPRNRAAGTQPKCPMPSFWNQSRFGAAISEL